MTKNKECGFTLIELMIAMAIFSVVMVAVYGVYISYSRTATVQNASAAAQQSVRFGIDLMGQDIRMAGFDPQETAYDPATYVGTPSNPRDPIEVAQVNKIRITSDLNADGDIYNDDDLFEIITYELSGTDLKRILYEGEANESPQPLISNVTKLEFVYLDSGDNVISNPLANIDDIVTVEITLEVTEPAGNGNQIARLLVTQAYCRNLDL